jgi:DNA-binding FadR family transcriptional regulator
LPVKRATGLTTAAARTVLVPLPESGGRAELVARRLGEAIRFGLIADGDRLPAEPALAAQLGVSTVTLREALTTLRAQGLITTRRGRGGGSFARTPADQAEPLRRFGAAELRDLGDQRGAVLGAAAKLAAERAQPDEVHQLEQQLVRLRGADGARERRRASTELTVAVAAAAQSPRLTHEEARLRSELGDLLEAGDPELLGALVAAIGAGEAERARALAERHVRAETRRLIELRLLAPEAAGPLEDLAEELARVLAALEDLGARFAALRAVRREDLAPLRETILAVIAGHEELVTGAGVITAPGLLADAPRWLEWWWLGAGGPEALRVNLDPAAPDFYDYTTADWYETPRRTGRPWMSGPYVDYLCTNAYAVTLAVPCGELGIAAADVLVASLERRVAPALAALGRPAALTNAAGRVIAANSAAVAPGQRLALDGARTRSAPVPGWRVVDL